MSIAPPAGLQYSADHEWLDASSPARIGITSVAAEALGDIVYVELPTVGATLVAGAVIGEIESTKSVSELFSPVDGTVVEVNTAVVDDPSLVNADPYGAGWLLAVDVTGTGPLLTADEYAGLNPA